MLDYRCRPLRISYESRYPYDVIFKSKKGIDTTEKADTPTGNPLQDLEQLFHACKDMFENLPRRVGRNENQFQKLEVNYQYFHTMLVEEFERLENTSIRATVDGKDQAQMLEELRELEVQANRWHDSNSCKRMLSKIKNSLEYPAPTLFVVLPWKPFEWDPSDQTTHEFRLYFLCHNKKSYGSPSGIPQHIHFASHSGYSLIRPGEFFQRYSGYILRVLRMIKLGCSDYDDEVPPLDTLKILWDGDSGSRENSLSEVTLGPLIDKAIAYLQELSIPKSLTGLEMTRKEGANIRRYLDVPDGVKAEGNLYKFIDLSLRVSWICHDHACQYLDPKHMRELWDFVFAREGYLDLQHAALKVNLKSTAEADLFRTLLLNIKHSFNITIKLCWKVSRTYLKELCLAIDDSSVVRLEIDGITTDTHSQDHALHMIDLFASIIWSARLKFIILLNYPRPQEQCYYTGDCFFLSSVSPARPDLDWVGLRDALRSFSAVISVETTGASDCMKAARTLQSRLVGLGFSDVTEVRVHRNNWDGTLNLQAGVFIELALTHLRHTRVLFDSGSLRTLTLDLVDQESEQNIYRLLQSNPGLQKLNISILGRDVPYLIEFIARLWSNAKSSLLLTLIERTESTRGRITAQVGLGLGCRPESGPFYTHGAYTPRSSPQVQTLPIPISFLQWNCDYSLSPTSDYSAKLLDISTQEQPLSLTSFTLDISSLSQIGLGFIQNFFRFSNLEHLRIQCTPVYPSMSDLISQILDAVPWSTLKSLKLIGDHVDEWLQLWAPATVTDSQLLCLHIQAVGSAPLELSHASVLYVHRVVLSSLLMELFLENIQLQDKCDWKLIVDSLDSTVLETFGLCEKSTAQLISVTDAWDLFCSKYDVIHQVGEHVKTEN